MKVLFVEYCAKDILDGTIQMDPLTELVYRRLLDMIYSTNDQLLDNDALQYATKAGSKWKKIRSELIEVHGKIYIEDGYIRNVKCSEKLAKSRKNIEQKSAAGKASSEARKSLENNKTTSTAVETAEPTSEVTNQEPKNSIDKKKKNKKEKEFEEFWQACPKKVGKGAARDKYWKARDNISAADLLKAIKQHGREVADRDKQYIPNPATWLHQERYHDEMTIPESEPMDEWPDWKRALSARIGDHNVKGWLGGVSYLNGKMMIPRRFQMDKIKNEFAIDIEHVLGHCEMVLMQ